MMVFRDFNAANLRIILDTHKQIRVFLLDLINYHLKRNCRSRSVWWLASICCMPEPMVERSE